MLVHVEHQKGLPEGARLRVIAGPVGAHLTALEVPRQDRPAASAGETHTGEAKQFLPARERSAGARNRICHRSTRMPVAAEVAEVELVQRGRVRERQLALLERSDQKRRRVLGNPRQFLLGAVQVLDRAAIVVLVVRDDQPLGQSAQLRRIERQRFDGVHGVTSAWR